MKCAVAVAVLLAACGGSSPAKPACLFPDGGAATPIDLDVLFLVQNDSSADVQDVLVSTSFAKFHEQLAGLPGGMPNLHIGVISSDLGAGPYAVQSCERVDGDRGVLQNQAVKPGCPALAARYLSDVASASGRDTNYPGTLDDAFACIARLGSDGCGFERHLDSLKRALDGSAPENAGFLRPDALLAVVIVADQDDCSARPPYALYDPSPAGIAAVGPMTSFRCTEYGLKCDPDLPWRTMPGPRMGCESNEHSPYLQPVQPYVDFLTQLKGDRRKVFVEAIAGDAGPVAVGVDAQNNPLLLPSCSAMRVQNAAAQPGVRLIQFARAFDANGSFFSFCADDKTLALAPLVQSLSDAVSCR